MSKKKERNALEIILRRMTMDGLVFPIAGLLGIYLWLTYPDDNLFFLIMIFLVLLVFSRKLRKVLKLV